MEKIFITFEHLSMDLQLAAENKKAYNVLNIFTYIAVFGSILGMFLLAKENFIGLLFMLASTICLLVEVFGRRIVDGRSAKIVTESILQGELCVSVETLDHVERKVIEEPYDSREGCGKERGSRRADRPFIALHPESNGLRLISKLIMLGLNMLLLGQVVLQTFLKAETNFTIFFSKTSPKLHTYIPANILR